MSLNVYFTDKVKELPGFESKPFKDGSGNRMSIDGMTLLDDKGRLYAMLGDENSLVPEKLRDCVDGFSFYEWIPQVAKRETGVYRHGSAEAELEDDWGGGKRPKYRVKITGEKIEDVRQLFRMIKVGSIRPEESYEGQQQGLSRVELEAELAQALLDGDQLFEQLRVAESRTAGVTEACRILYQKNVTLHHLVQTLRGETWGLCRKATVASRIKNILDDPSS